jgi:hypothetical protein
MGESPTWAKAVTIVVAIWLGLFVLGGVATLLLIQPGN